MLSACSSSIGDVKGSSLEVMYMMTWCGVVLCSAQEGYVPAAAVIQGLINI